MGVTAYIVEDEPLARQALRRFVDDVDWLECIGAAADGATAIEAIDTLRPALIFLDVRIPVFDGLDVLRRIRHKPEVVFTTAFDQYAVTAFEIGAIDYLIKPFGLRRFEKAMERLRATLVARGASTGAERAVDTLTHGRLRRLFTRRGREIVPIALDEVRRIEACGDYVAIHHPGGATLMHVSLGELDARLDPERFVRVHRSHIVGLDHVAAIRPRDDHRFAIVLDDGTEIAASRAGSLRVRARLR